MAEIAAPRAGQRLAPRGTVKARVSDPDGDKIVSVEILACPGETCDPTQAAVIGRHAHKPWKMRIASPIQSGELTLIARVTTNDGETGLSAPVTVTVAGKGSKSADDGKGRDGRRDGKRGGKR